MLQVQDSAILGQMWGTGSMSLLGGSYVTVEDEGLDDFEDCGALVRLITRDSNPIEADTCISELDEDGESFALTVEFEADGEHSSCDHCPFSAPRAAGSGAVGLKRVEEPPPGKSARRRV